MKATLAIALFLLSGVVYASGEPQLLVPKTAAGIRKQLGWIITQSEANFRKTMIEKDSDWRLDPDLFPKVCWRCSRRPTNPAAPIRSRCRSVETASCCRCEMRSPTGKAAWAR